MQFDGRNTASYSPSSTLVESLASFLRWRVGLGCVAGGFCQCFAEGVDCTDWLKPVLLSVADGRPARPEGGDENR